MTQPGKKILIIGGTGLIGPYLLQELNRSFTNATIVTMTRTGKSFFTETSVKAARGDASQFEALLRDVAPDILIDMIPFTAEHAQITSSFIKQISPDLPVIALSSIDVYAAYAKLHRTENIAYQNCPLTEASPLRQKFGPEGRKYDKLNVEKIYRQTLENVTILRLPATYGWPDTSRIETYLDPVLDRQESITLSTEQANWKFSRCLHKNAAYAILKTIEADQCGHHTYNVAEPTAHTELQWCQKIATLCGWHGEIILSDNMPGPIDFAQDLFVSSDKIRNDIHFHEKYSPDDGLADCIKLHAYARFKTPYKQSY